MFRNFHFSIRIPALLAPLCVLCLAACEVEQTLPGERIDTRESLGADQAPPPNEVRSISLPSAQRNSDWPQRAFNAQNRVPHGVLSASAGQVWVADIGQGNRRRAEITADPVAAGGLVFTMDSNSLLVATNIRDGARAWSADLTAEFDRGGGVFGGGLAVSGGVVYASTGYGELIALGASDGAIRWRQRLGAGLGTPTVRGNAVYVMSNAAQAWSVDTSNGRIKWQIAGTQAQAVLSGGAAPAATGSLVILPFATGEIQAVFPGSGARIWSSFIAGGRPGAAYAAINNITSDPVVVGGTVYAGNQSGYVVAIDTAIGTQRWQGNDGAYSPVLAAGDSLFFVSDRNELLRIEAQSGRRIWAQELPLYVNERLRRRRAVFTHFGPILAGGQLLLASGDDTIRLHSPQSGDITRILDLPGGAAAHPIVVDGTLLVVSTNGNLYAYR
jgi:outer membrane protein assembly factor BamB